MNKVIDDPTVQRLKAMMQRHRMTQPDAAQFLGVPLGTLRNWLQGVRKPPASAVRLVQVLELAEAMSPMLYAALRKS